MLDAFHIVKLAGDTPGEVRHRVQQETLGRCGRTGDPLYQIQLLLRPYTRKLSPRQQERHRAAFTADGAHISAEVACHRAQQVCKECLAARLVERLPTYPIPEIAHLCRTLRRWKGAPDACFDTAGLANGPSEAHNGVIEKGRRSTRGYRNPTTANSECSS